jgi:hypothetical protein
MKVKHEVVVNGRRSVKVGSPTTTFKEHVFSELTGTARLDRIARIQFMSSGVVKDETTSFSYEMQAPNKIRIYGSYTPSSSYTLDNLQIVTSSGYTYFSTPLTSPVSVISGVPVNFEWRLELSPNRATPTGFLSKFNLDMTSSEYRLLAAICKIILLGRSSAFPGGISLKPARCDVIASDGSTVIAQSTNIQMTADDVAKQVTYDTGNMQVTTTTTSNEWIRRIRLVDTVSGGALIQWDYVQYEYVQKGDYVRVQISISV